MATVKLKLIRSVIGRPRDQKDTVRALGLNRINQIVEKEKNPQIQGMIDKVRHLLEIVEE